MQIKYIMKLLKNHENKRFPSHVTMKAHINALHFIFSVFNILAHMEL